MAVSTYLKSHLDLTSVENWKYTTTNNVKKLTSQEEAKRFILGTEKIWRLGQYTGGTSILQSLTQSIDDCSESTTTGFPYVDNNGDHCYLLFLIERRTDGKSIQITHTHHKLSRSGARKAAADCVQVQDSNVTQWLMQRACNELHLSQQATADMMMIQKNNTFEYRPLQYTYKETDLSAGEAKDTTTKVYSTSHHGENRHHNIYRQDDNRQHLLSISYISNFCQYMSNYEELLEHLTKRIQTVKSCKELSYKISISNQDKHTLTFIMLPENDFVRLCFLSELSTNNHKNTRSADQPMDH
jgi:hypothetical protein